MGYLVLPVQTRKKQTTLEYTGEQRVFVFLKNKVEIKSGNTE